MKILLALDESEYSKAAITEVSKRSWPTRSTVRVLAVVEPFPQMAIDPWYGGRESLDQIDTELKKRAGNLTKKTVVGGAALLKYLSEENVEKSIAGLFLLAAPSRDEENWNFDDLRLPRDLAAKLSRIPQIFLYHNRDDEVVPVSHLALHAARLPRAFRREGDKGGHQFGNDLANVAGDIRTLLQVNADKTS